jgi:hypothetical protein
MVIKETAAVGGKRLHQGLAAPPLHPENTKRYFLSICTDKVTRAAGKREKAAFSVL